MFCKFQLNVFENIRDKLEKKSDSSLFSGQKFLYYLFKTIFILKK